MAESGKGECTWLNGISFEPKSFRFVTLEARTKDDLRAALRVGASSLPLSLAADGRWHRVALRLPKDAHVASLAITVESDGAAALDVDELAVVREETLTEADRLRDLCERYAADRKPDLTDLMARATKIDAAQLEGQDLVDHALLVHALAYDRETEGLPAKQNGVPAGEKRFLLREV